MVLEQTVLENIFLGTDGVFRRGRSGGEERGAGPPHARPARARHRARPPGLGAVAGRAADRDHRPRAGAPLGRAAAGRGELGARRRPARPAVRLPAGQAGRGEGDPVHLAPHGRAARPGRHRLGAAARKDGGPAARGRGLGRADPGPHGRPRRGTRAGPTRVGRRRGAAPPGRRRRRCCAATSSRSGRGAAASRSRSPAARSWASPGSRGTARSSALALARSGLARPAGGQVAVLDEQGRSHPIRRARDAASRGSPTCRATESTRACSSRSRSRTTSAWRCALRADRGRASPRLAARALPRPRRPASASRRAGRETPSAPSAAGTSRRSCSARWLATEPSLLVLNDPLRGVDPNTKDELYELLRELSGTG